MDAETTVSRQARTSRTTIGLRAARGRPIGTADVCGLPHVVHAHEGDHHSVGGHPGIGMRS